MKKTMCGLLAVVAFFTAVEANALSLAYTLDQNEAGITGGPWATITLEDAMYDGKDAVHFVVTPLEKAFASVDHFGLESFYFNENTGPVSGLAVKLINLECWSLANSSTRELDGIDTYGKFDFKFFRNGNGGDEYRAIPLEFYLYTTQFDIQAVQFAVSNNANIMFAAHIGGFKTTDSNGMEITSADFASTGNPVPEPGTVALLSLGLACLAVYKRRCHQ